MHARSRQTGLFAVVVLGLVVVLAGSTFAQSSNTSVGTWKLNIAKSTFAAGTIPQSGGFTIAEAGADIKVTVDWVAANGTVTHYGFTVRYDGKDYPITGNPSRDGVAMTRVDANTLKIDYKKGGKVVSAQTAVVSSDGKVCTIAAVNTDAQGKTVKSVAVYDKK